MQVTQNLPAKPTNGVYVCNHLSNIKEESGKKNNNR